jgi:anaerobic ribonucleoside-triphosphate reductase
MNEIICWDCKMTVGEGERYYVYQVDDKEYYKCKQCFDHKKELSNFRPCQVYSRVCGYYQPTSNWNDGKKEEFSDRKEFIGNDKF